MQIMKMMPILLSIKWTLMGFLSTNPSSSVFIGIKLITDKNQQHFVNLTLLYLYKLSMTTSEAQ